MACGPTVARQMIFGGSQLVFKSMFIGATWYLIKQATFTFVHLAMAAFQSSQRDGKGT